MDDLNKVAKKYFHALRPLNSSHEWHTTASCPGKTTCSRTYEQKPNSSPSLVFAGFHQLTQVQWLLSKSPNFIFHFLNNLPNTCQLGNLLFRVSVTIEIKTELLFLSLIVSCWYLYHMNFEGWYYWIYIKYSYILICNSETVSMHF